MLRLRIKLNNVLGSGCLINGTLLGILLSKLVQKLKFICIQRRNSNPMTQRKSDPRINVQIIPPPPKKKKKL